MKVTGRNKIRSTLCKSAPVNPEKNISGQRNYNRSRRSFRKHKDIKLVTNKEAYLRNVMKPNFKSGVLFGENLMGCEVGKIKVEMNKPVYLGQAILDLSNIVTYEFHYDYMVPRYGKNLKLCYIDTDSLVYHIRPKITRLNSKAPNGLNSNLKEFAKTFYELF